MYMVGLGWGLRTDRENWETECLLSTWLVWVGVSVGAGEDRDQ